MSRSESDSEMVSTSESESDDDVTMQPQPQSSEEESASEHSSDFSSEEEDESEAEEKSEAEASDAPKSPAKKPTKNGQAPTTPLSKEEAERKRARREAGAKLREERRVQREAAAAIAKTAADRGVPLTSTILNPQIKSLKPDFYYHLGLSSDMPLKAMFGDVRFVIVSGSPVRAHETIQKVIVALNIQIPLGTSVQPIGKTERYSLYKAGPVLSVSHGMGKPSISILLHELAKLLAASGAIDQTTFIRVGTSGGLGVPPGTVIVSSSTVNGALEPTYPVIVLGQQVNRPCRIDPDLVDAIMRVPSVTKLTYKVMKGITMATDDFYEGQGRLDGAICEYTLKDKMDFIRKAHAAGVRNIEMESDAIVAFCTKLHIKCAVICATIVDRLVGDQVTSTPQQLVGYTDSAVEVALRYIQKQLGVKPGKQSRAQRLASKAEKKASSVAQVAGSSEEFPAKTVAHHHAGQIKEGKEEEKDAAAVTETTDAKPNGTANNNATAAAVASSKKKKHQNKDATQTPKKGEKKADAANGSSKKKDAKTPSKKEEKKDNSTASTKKNKKVAPAETPKKSEGKTPTTPAASEKKKKKEKQPAATETPKKGDAKKSSDAANGTPNGTSKKKKEKNANNEAPKTPAKPAAAVTESNANGTETASKLNRREKKKLAEEAAAAEKAAAEKKAADEAAQIAANRAADLAKFDPDRPVKVHRPTKNERKAMKEAAIKAALAAGAPAPTSAQVAAGAFQTPVKAAAPSNIPATTDGNEKKRKRAGEDANKAGTEKKAKKVALDGDAMTD